MIDFGEDEWQDEWEWPADCKAQREMESHLRCQICGDYFHGPVLLPCSHTFCSACVRRFLQSKGAHGCCPSCKHPCTSRDLVPNRALEQVTLLFETSKPELLRRLQCTTVPSSATCTPTTEKGKIKKTKYDKPERLPVMSYSVMRDKEVRKLLDSINVRVPTKNREEIIQIHKEYVLLSNAQADSVNPKSIKELREEVVRNHYARMQQKAKTDAFKRSHSGDENAASGNIASPSSGVTIQMRANFEKLRQDIADRKAGKTLSNSTQTTTGSLTNTPAQATSKDDDDVVSAVGVWRHFCALDTSIKQEFYVNSVTHEIRTELPSPLVQEQSPANRYDDLNGVARAFVRKGSTDVSPDDEVKVATSVKGKTKAQRAIAPAFASPDATSELQNASEGIVISDNGHLEEGTDEVSGDKKREGFGKRARSDDDTDAANDLIYAIEDTNETPSKWQCSRCTLINEDNCHQCEACGYEPTLLLSRKLFPLRGIEEWLRNI
ncbi:e3 ubiquitin ligase [Plasmopara halstedii]|uniref:RanBP-type and C3HC4-type zinc finger-containing protein 1 n=1 Tax=Plasmopara halstedii TaxID=4781 RepID=A0A0P1AK45_PLAHL|nr:e3 ubiquitin ligase [Plasmopara halstedii]CEG41612.1 e3 ubiquitin ligase [Plasmopara halstedii]|eukprot:XP_024577981.1 e3 ubiquitin ligase [Plasmopara halstedii]